MMTRILVHGTFVSAPDPAFLDVRADSWLLAEDSRIVSLTGERPADTEDAEVRDFGDYIIIPPFTDIHLHAPQYLNRGLGQDMQLLDWLEHHTYPEEKRFSDLEFAGSVFGELIDELVHIGSLRTVIFSSLHADAALLLMQMLAEAGLESYVGKVNMDCNGVPGLQETTEESVRETLRWLDSCKELPPRVKPIITPRFAPSCTPALLTELGKIVEKYDLPVQSHLNETPEEVAWVAELFPDRSNYLDVYDYYGLLPRNKTIMAHCIYNTPAEDELLARRGVLMAHCPTSNLVLGSGIMNVKRYLGKGWRLGLGSDISGGESLSMHDIMHDALKSSALICRSRNSLCERLNYAEIFHMATRGGSSFFGNCGAFEPDMPLDYLAIDDSMNTRHHDLTIEERLQKFMFLGAGIIKERCLGGRRLNAVGHAWD